MRVILFGASGMVGQGVLRECLLDPAVQQIVSVGRSRLPQAHSKLREVQLDDLFDIRLVADQISGFDACFFCLGISSFRRKEAEYRHVTQALTVSIARAVLGCNPDLVFVYVSGAGTNPGSRTMWSRVKGETEASLLAMPFRAAYMFRPGLIVPMDGIRSKTPVYRAMYWLLTPLLLLLRRSARLATTTRAVGRAMLRAAETLPAQVSMDNQAINRLGR